MSVPWPPRRRTARLPIPRRARPSTTSRRRVTKSSPRARATAAGVGAPDGAGARSSASLPSWQDVEGAANGAVTPTIVRRSPRSAKSAQTKSAAKRSRRTSFRFDGGAGSLARSPSYRFSARSVAASASRRSARCRRSGGSRSSPPSSARISASTSGSSSNGANSNAKSPVADRKKELASVDLVSHSSLHTERLGERLGRAARPNDVFALSGELGTGKTVLARGVAIGLGIDPADISSPTFIIMREHGGGRLPFFHIDLYRLEGVDLANTGWEECLDAGGVTVIEWPDRAGPLLPDDRLEVKLEHIADTKRRIVVAATGPRSAQFVEELRASVISA